MHPDSPCVPVSLREVPISLLPNDDNIIVLGVLRLHGVLCLDDDFLSLEYQILVPDINWRVPAQIVRIPLSAISEVVQQGRWWRPRLEVQARQPSAFGALPLVDGCLRFRIARSDRLRAKELAASAMLRRAELTGSTAAELPAAASSEGLPQPPRGE